MFKKIVYLIFVFLFWNFSNAQQYVNYNAKNGLPSNHIYRIIQDYKGYIWFLTDNGIVKFNGTEFKTFTTKEGLPTNDIWDVRITPDNKFWFFSKAIKLGFIKNDSIFTFKSSNENEILYPNIINQNGNKINFIINNKTYNLVKNKWVPISSNHSDFYEERLIHSKYHSIYYKKDTDDVFLVPNKQQNKNLYKIPFIRSNKYRGQINDSLYCGISDNQIVIINLNNDRITNILDSTYNKKFQVTRFSAVNNNIQFSGNNYVSFLDENYKLSKTIKIPKKFQSHFSFVDKNDNLWIATRTNGVYFLPASKRKATYQFENLKVGKINLIKGDIITNVYNKGFYKFNKITKNFEPYVLLKNHLYNAIDIQDLDEVYFLSNVNAVVLKNGKEKLVNNNDKARNLIYYNNFLYGNTSFGLLKFDPKNYKIIDEYKQYGLRDLLLFRQKFLLATSNGLKEFKNNQISPVQKLKNFNKPIISIEKISENEMVICTDGFGAYLTDLDTISLLEKSEFLDVNNAFVYKKDIFLATNKGVWKYSKHKNRYKLIKKITTTEGLNTNHIKDLYIKNDTLITTSNRGISILNIKNKISNPFLNIFLDKVRFNQNIVSKNAVFQYINNNQLHIKTIILDFSETPDQTYQYVLKPIQKKWSTTHSNEISFSDLPANNYIFQVKKDGKFDSVNFTIKPLWYQRWWFKIISRISFLALIFSIVFYYKKRDSDKQKQKLIEQKKMAEYELHALRSQMNPHFVFNSLNAIQYYITKNNIDLSEKYLVKFSRLIRMFFDFSREKEIPLSEEIKLLNSYLEIEKMRFGSNFNYEINIIGSLNTERYKIPTMLLQPIVENAVNHGLFHNKGKGLIAIDFELFKNNNFKVSISDNGVGLKKAKEIQQKSIHIKKKNNSTNVIKERIHLLNQSNKWFVSYTIFEKEKGTIVILNFKKNESN